MRTATILAMPLRGRSGGFHPEPVPVSALPGASRYRGFAFLYRAGEQNHCPGCGRSHWKIGRSSAECAFCATALPFAGDR